MIFGRLICVFGGLAPVPTPVHASVEDITSLQSVKKILLQLYGITKATLAVFFYIVCLFGDGDGEGGRPTASP